MAATKYTYSVSGDTLNGKVDLSHLDQDIRDSAIVTALDYLNKSADVFDIWFKDALSTGDETVLDGIVAAHDGEPLPKPEAPKTSTGVPLTAVVEPEGDFLSYVSHDYCNIHSWYSRSVAKTGVTLTSGSPTEYYIPNPDKLVYLKNGAVMDEDALYPAYALTVYDNGTPVDEADYTVDPSLDEITFNSAPTGPVTADYHAAGTSVYVLKPATGKRLIIKKAEVQLAKNVAMTPIAFQIWVYNPMDLPNKIMYQQRVYKNEKDVISIGNEGQGFIPSFGNLTQDVIVFPFYYSRPIILNDSQGVELRIGILDDVPFPGEWATVTLYAVEEDEA